VGFLSSQLKIGAEDPLVGVNQSIGIVEPFLEIFPFEVSIFSRHPKQSSRSVDSGLLQVISLMNGASIPNRGWHRRGDMYNFEACSVVFLKALAWSMTAQAFHCS
jgi:hypothetical protein